MPGVTETAFFERAGLLDTQVGQGSKDNPAEVACVGFDAMMKGKGDVVSGWQNEGPVRDRKRYAGWRPRGAAPQNDRAWLWPEREIAFRLKDENSGMRASRSAVPSPRSTTGRQWRFRGSMMAACLRQKPQTSSLNESCS